MEDDRSGDQWKQQWRSTVVADGLLGLLDVGNGEEKSRSAVGFGDLEWVCRRDEGEGGEVRSRRLPVVQVVRTGG